MDNPGKNNTAVIEGCLARLAQSDQSAWNELLSHAFERLLAMCGRMVHQELSKPNPLITENTVLAEMYKRLRTAMENEKVRPTTARAFFGLAARNIRWQIQDMVRKPSPGQQDERVLESISAGKGVMTQILEREKWNNFWDAVEKLEPDQREVFDMIYVNGLSQYEVADEIGKTRNQVDSIWRRAKMKIVESCSNDFMSF